MCVNGVQADNLMLAMCRLEAEMAALDVGELLHHKLAAEAAAQAEADRSASIANQLAKVC